MDSNNMPLLKPVPIKTKGLPWWKATYVWLTACRKWELAQSWNFEWDGINWVIQKGFIFDGASVPRFFWWLYSPTGILLMPAVIHDYIYQHEYLFTEKYRQVRFTRSDADKAFKKIATDVNGFKILNWLPYFMLVLFGWIAWNKNRKN